MTAGGPAPSKEKDALHRTVDLRILGKAFRIECPDERFESWMRGIYSEMDAEAAPGADGLLSGGTIPAAPVVVYRIERTPGGSGPDQARYRVHGGPVEGSDDADSIDLSTATSGEALSRFEDALTIALQLQRPDLMFVHAAALVGERGAVAIVGDSGAGKSTLAWALARRGFAYLSDELAPFDVDRAEIIPFPRAIHLKVPPPGLPPLPHETIVTHTSLCVPVELLAGGVAKAPTRLDALCFLAPSPRPHQPVLRPLTAGRAVPRLFSHTLNALAHPHYGVDAAIRLAREARCFELAAADLDETCDLLAAALAAD